MLSTSAMSGYDLDCTLVTELARSAGSSPVGSPYHTLSCLGAVAVLYGNAATDIGTTINGGVSRCL